MGGWRGQENVCVCRVGVVARAAFCTPCPFPGPRHMVSYFPKDAPMITNPSEPCNHYLFSKQQGLRIRILHLALSNRNFFDIAFWGVREPMAWPKPSSAVVWGKGVKKKSYLWLVICSWLGM